MKRALIVIALLGVCVVLSVLEANSQGPGTDFHARWMFGRWFWAGDPLYADVPGVRGPNLYPPFAAMLFQLHALLPLKVAAGLFYSCNLLLIPVAVRLTIGIFDVLWPDRPRNWWRLALAILFSAQFFLNNLNLVQVNLVLFVLCLLGIRWYLAGHDVRAAAALVAATAIKVVPVFLVAWLIARGRRRAALAVVPLGIACVALPIVQRGPETGVRDLADYYHQLRGFAEGPVVQSYTNQNLAAGVYRLLRPPSPAVSTERDYRVFTASEATARAVYGAGAWLVVAGFLATLVWLRVRGAPLTVFELSAGFLAGHLLSGMTWKAHLVTLLFVFYAFLSLDRRALGRGERALAAAALGLMAVSGLSGRDLFGDTIHHYVGGYSVIVWTMVLLFACSLLRLLPPPLRASSAIRSAP
jgi:hypothetical protein